MRFIIYLFFIALLAATNSAFAQDTLYNQETASIEKYFNNIKTLKSDFIQTIEDGSKLKGVFMLKRPGKLRFEYNTPLKDFIVADGSFIHYYDGEMKQRSSMSIDNSLANFFLRKNINLSDGVEISDFISDKNSIEITVSEKGNKLAGALTLFFNKNPLQLTKWRITDAQGITTWIELKNLEFGGKLDNNLFYYYDPEKKKMIINK